MKRILKYFRIQPDSQTPSSEKLNTSLDNQHDRQSNNNNKNRNKNNANLNIPSLFTVGEIVKIDNDTTAYIIEIRGEKFDYFFKVKYIIDNRIESNVSEHRCKVVSINEKNTST